MPEPGSPSRRLVGVRRELAQLRQRHDMAMSAFLFEEATALGREIAELEKEEERLAREHPPAPEPPVGIVPVLERPGRRPRHRR